MLLRNLGRVEARNSGVSRHLNWGGACLSFLFCPFSSCPPLLPSLFSRDLPLFSPFSLKVRLPKIQLEGLGSAVSFYSGVWGRVPAKIEFGAF